MDTQPLISVIVPAYNMEPYIEQCVGSIAAQTYRNLEIILIDDGSTDATGSICDRFAKADSRVTVIHQENQGLARSRKIGVHAASGKYIGFVDSDDWIDAEMYTYLYRRMQETKAQIVTSGYIEEFANDSSTCIPGYLPEGVYHPKEDLFFCQNMIFSNEKMLWGISPNFWNKLFDRETLLPFLERVDDRITNGEDDACVYPCMAFAETVCVTNLCFYHYRMRERSMSKAADERYFIGINLMYLVMKSGFSSHPLAAYLMKELDAYIFRFALRGINDLWGIRPEYRLPEFRCNCECLDVAKGTVLYAAGVVGRSCYQQLVSMNLHQNILWVDRNFEELQKQGLPVYSPLEILERPYMPVMVAVQSQGLYESIRKELMEMGIESNRISWAEPRSFF